MSDIPPAPKRGTKIYEDVARELRGLIVSGQLAPRGKAPARGDPGGALRGQPGDDSRGPAPVCGAGSDLDRRRVDRGLRDAREQRPGVRVVAVGPRLADGRSGDLAGRAARDACSPRGSAGWRTEHQTAAHVERLAESSPVELLELLPVADLRQRGVPLDPDRSARTTHCFRSRRVPSSSSCSATSSVPDSTRASTGRSTSITIKSPPRSRTATPWPPRAGCSSTSISSVRTTNARGRNARSGERAMLPLADVRILSVEQFGAGPWATLQLADLGADVIKIEDPAAGGDVGRYVPPFQDGEDSLFFETLIATSGASRSIFARPPGGRCSMIWSLQATWFSRTSAATSRPGSASRTRRSSSSIRESSAARCQASA